MSNDFRNLNTIPAGALGLLPLESCKGIGEEVDKYLVGWRRERKHEHEGDITFSGYARDSYVIKASCPRFGSGEAKGTIKGISTWLRSVYFSRYHKLQPYLQTVRYGESHVSG